MGTRKKQAITKAQPAHTSQPLVRRIGYTIGYVAWVIFLFYAVQFLVVQVVQAIVFFGVNLATFNQVALQAILSAIVYSLVIALAVALPWWLLKQRTTRKELGLEQRLPSWLDLGLAPLAYITTLMVGSIIIITLQKLVPQIDFTQAQQVGFDATTITQRYELLLVYLTLAVLAPVAEELLFRGYLFGKLRAYLSTTATIVVTAIIFSALHLGLGQLEKLQWNVAIITLLLGVVLGVLRAKTNSVWAGIVLHMIQNTVAFIVLFAVPVLLRGTL